MAVFHAVERNVWKRGLLLIALLAVAAVVYVTSDANLPLRVPSQSVEENGAPILEETVLDSWLQQPVVGQGSVRVEPLQGGFFDEYRLERDRSRAMQLEQLRQLLEAEHVAAADQETINTLLTLLERTEKELQAEGLLRARGMSDALVVVAEAGAIVVVSEPINANEAASIGDVVSRVTGVPLDRITISDGLRLQ